MKNYVLFNDTFFKQKPWWIPQKLYKVVCNRANPRTREYMITMLEKQLGDFEIITSLDSIKGADRVVLAYQDSIGLGWNSTENILNKHEKNLWVLNGRGRFFNLDNPIQKEIRLKRFLEMTFTPELILLPFILVCGLLLSIKDCVIRRS